MASNIKQTFFSFIFAYIMTGQYDDRKWSGRERGGRDWEKSAIRDSSFFLNRLILQLP